MTALTAGASPARVDVAKYERAEQGGSRADGRDFGIAADAVTGRRGQTGSDQSEKGAA